MNIIFTIFIIILSILVSWLPFKLGADLKFSQKRPFLIISRQGIVMVLLLLAIIGFTLGKDSLPNQEYAELLKVVKNSGKIYNPDSGTLADATPATLAFKLSPTLVLSKKDSTVIKIPVSNTGLRACKNVILRAILIARNKSTGKVEISRNEDYRLAQDIPPKIDFTLTNLYLNDTTEVHQIDLTHYYLYLKIWFEDDHGVPQSRVSELFECHATYNDHFQIVGDEEKRAFIMGALFDSGIVTDNLRYSNQLKTFEQGPLK